MLRARDRAQHHSWASAILKLFVKIHWLLIFVPLAIGARILNLSPTMVFVLAFLAVISLASLIAQSVDDLAFYTGPGVGALLSATFGTVTELFILFNLLRFGQLAVMQSEISGLVLLGPLLIVGLTRSSAVSLRLRRKRGTPQPVVRLNYHVRCVMPATIRMCRGDSDQDFTQHVAFPGGLLCTLHAVQRHEQEPGNN